MSHQAELRRFDMGNGNYSSRVGPPQPQHPLPWLCQFLLSIAIAGLPVLVRWFTGQPLQGQGTAAEWMIVISSFLLTATSSMSLFTVLRSFRLSLQNYAEKAEAFTTVCFNSHVNKWFPILNLLEPINVESWYFLRQHIVGVHPVAFSARALALLSIAGFTIAWGTYAVVYVALAPDPIRLEFEGWTCASIVLSVLLAVPTATSLHSAAKVNSTFRSHLNALSLTKVATNEELAGNMEGRTKAEIGTLLDVQGILADVMFVLRSVGDPIEPLGLGMDAMAWAVYVVLCTVIVVPLALLAVSSGILASRWGIPTHLV